MSTTRTVQLSNGISLQLRVWKSSQEIAQLIFLHGWGDHSGRYDALAKSLNKIGVSCYGPDFEGHGLTAGSRARVHDFQALHLQLKELILYIKPTALFLHGHSMGGCLAAHHAIKYPQDIKGIIFNSAALKVNSKISVLKRTAAMLLGSGFAFLKVGYLKHPQHMSQIPEEIANYEADQLLYHGRIDSGTGKALILANAYVGENLELITTPFLALQGERDELVDPEGAKQLHTRARSPDKSLVIYPNSKHDLLHDVDRVSVYEQIHNWIQTRTHQAL